MNDQPKTWGAHTSAKVVAEYYSNELEGRVVLLTGPSKEGVGLATALALASQKPRLLILAGRTVSKLEEAKAEVLKAYPGVEIHCLKCDLSNVASVKQAAEDLNKGEENIDIVINNAAVMDTPYELTSDGFELQLQSNYLGHWLLVSSIMPKILAGKNKRVVNVSSMGHAYGGINWDDPNFTKGGYTPHLGYGQSKTAMNLHSIELTRRYRPQGLMSFSLHPGGIASPLQKHWTLEDKLNLNKYYGESPSLLACPISTLTRAGKVYDEDGNPNPENSIWKTPDEGSSTTLRAALDPTLAEHSGAYLDDCQLANEKCTPYAADKAAAERLWAWTNYLLGTDF